jgi:hypothetical protein
MSRRLSPEYADRVDQKKWERPFDINNEKDQTTKIVIEYILYRLT